MGSTVLTISLLGALSVRCDGRPIALPQSKKTRALLAFLALSDAPVVRDRLVGLLWDIPDDPRAALRWSLSKIRAVIDDQEVKRVLANRQTVALDLSAVDVDLRRIRDMTAAGFDMADRAELGDAAEHLAEGFLAGLDLPDCPMFQAWASGERQAVARLRADIIAYLGDGPPRAGDADFAVTTMAETPLPADPMLGRPAVAVLPFDNMSGDTDQEYFADGITEDIITNLSYWRWFPVIARHSTFAFKGRPTDVVTVGRELAARYIVQGSVRRAGNRVRVGTQLIDAETGLHVWAQRYDREFDDVFALQDELTEQIVSHMEPELQRAERRRAEQKPPQNLDAWDLNLQALAHVHRARADDFAAAHRLLDDSMRLDPWSSQTYAIRAFCLYHQALLVWSSDPVGSSGTFLGAAETAVELDEDNWLARALLGMSVLWNRRNYEQAAAQIERAIALNPSSAMAHQFLGCVYSFDGRPAEAIGHLHAARRLNPHRESATLLLADLALAHLLLRDNDQAIAFAQQAIREFSGNIRAWQRLSAAYGNQERDAEAADALQNLLQRQRALTIDYIDATYPFRDAGDRALLVGGLQRAGWKQA